MARDVGVSDKEAEFEVEAEVGELPVVDKWVEGVEEVTEFELVGIVKLEQEGKELMSVESDDLVETEVKILLHDGAGVEHEMGSELELDVNLDELEDTDE